MRILLTGGCGFVATNVALQLLNNSIDSDITLFDDLSRQGSENNLNLLETRGAVRFIKGDISKLKDIEYVVRETQPEVIFHFAGQVAMTKSLEDPLRDFEVNALGSMNLLESVRKWTPDSVVIYSSTNKVYGDLGHLKVYEDKSRYALRGPKQALCENIPVSFSSPYGCSKGSADQYFLDYYKIFQIKTIVFRHSSMYGGLQYPTFDQGWVSWFCQQGIETMKNENHSFSIAGNGKQVRDLLHVDDVVSLYIKSIHLKELYGQVFNIGGGLENSMSILELLSYIESFLGVKLNRNYNVPRVSDQKYFVADNFKIKSMANWLPEVNFREGLQRTMDWLIKIS